MNTFVLGGSGSGKSRYIIDQMREDIYKYSTLYLIVPEQHTVVWENLICRTFPPSAQKKIQVVSFSRLSNIIFRKYGGLKYSYIGKGGKRLLVFGAASALEGKLEELNAEFFLKNYSGVEVLSSAIDELKAAGISNGSLAEAAEFIDSYDNAGGLPGRLRDLSALWAAYERLADELGEGDAADDLERASSILSENDFFCGAAVYIDSFYTLTGVEEKLVRRIMKQANDVHMTFVLPSCNDEHPHFSLVKDFLRRMCVYAGETGGYETIELGETKRGRGRLAYLEKNLFSYDAPRYIGDNDTDCIRLIKVHDRYEEARACCAEIQRLVQSGVRYSEILVIASNAPSLSGIVDAALEEAGIPYFMSNRYLLSSAPISRLIMSVFGVIIHGWKREDLVSLVKTGISSVTSEEGDAFQQYTDTWRLRGRNNFPENEDWEMSSYGFDDTRNREREAKITCLANVARAKLVGPILQFEEIFEGGCLVSDACRALYQLLTELEVPSGILRLARNFEKSGRYQEAEMIKSSFNTVINLLDVALYTLGDNKTGVREFCSIISILLNSEDIGTIPPGSDVVQFGSAGDFRAGEGTIKHVLVLGMIDGEFPAAVQERGFFRDSDRELIASAGLKLGGGNSEVIEREFFLIYKILTVSSEGVILFYPEKNKTSSTTPSPALKRLRSLFPDMPEEKYNSDDADRWIYDSGAALHSAVMNKDSFSGTVIREILNVPESSSAVSDSDVISSEVASVLFGNRIVMSQSRLDSFVLCRLGYYARYVLELEDEKEATIKSVNAGNYMHKILEEYFLAVRDRDFPVDEAEKQAILDRVSKEYMSSLVNGHLTRRQIYMFGRLRKSAELFVDEITDEFVSSSFRPAFFETPVGIGDSIDSEFVISSPEIKFSALANSSDKYGSLSEAENDLYIKDKTISIRGVIDRIDICRTDEGTLVRVVDYKTGSKSFRLSDLSYGLNTQLSIYLMALARMPNGMGKEYISGSKNGTVIPAGMMYFSARPGEAASFIPLSYEAGRRIAGEAVKRDGLILDDEAVLDKMDSSDGRKYLPKKVRAGRGENHYLSKNELEGLFNHLDDVLSGVGRDILSGNVSAIPLMRNDFLPCEYCKIKLLCRRADGRCRQ